MSRRRPYLRDVVVLGAAVGVFGVSFGVAAAAAGLSPGQASALSLLVFTGASQFAAIAVVDSGGTIGAAMGSALLLAARNAAYGVALTPVLGGERLARRLGAAQLVIDESTAMSAAQADPVDRAGAFWAAGLAVFVFWNLGTLLGALAGSALGDPERFGLDAAFPAGFVALLAPHLRRRAGRTAAAAGALVALVLVPLTPPGVPILAAAMAVLPGLLFARPDRAGR